MTQGETNRLPDQDGGTVSKSRTRNDQLRTAETTRTFSTGITFCYRRGQIRIFKSVIASLQNPAYIRLLIHPEKKIVVVQARAQAERDTIEVPKNLYQQRFAFEINSMALLESITTMMGWSRQLTYRVRGELLPESGMVAFMLEMAVILKETEMVILKETEMGD